MAAYAAHQPESAQRVDWRGVVCYLVAALGLTWAIELGMILGGVRFDGIPPMFAQLVVAGVMWEPAVAVQVRFFSPATLHLLPWVSLMR